MDESGLRPPPPLNYSRWAFRLATLTRQLLAELEGHDHVPAVYADAVELVLEWEAELAQEQRALQ